MALNVTRLFPLPNWPPVYTEEQEISMGGAGSSSSVSGGTLKSNFGGVSNQSYQPLQQLKTEEKEKEDEIEDDSVEEKVKKQLDLL